MEGVTDTVFRQIIASCAKPDLFMTEFTSVEGYFSDGRQRVAESLKFTAQIEQPIVAQIWGKVPHTMQPMAEELAHMRFAGIDINMGCPDKNVVAHGCGGALIENTGLVGELIKAVKKGAPELPISVKTRLGFRSIETDTWIRFLLEQGLDALFVHGRTVRELSRVPAHWDEIGKVVRIRDKAGVATKIIGNGDVKDATDALEKSKKYGVDGVMIGRGIFENLWAFDRSAHPHIGTTQDLFSLMRQHIQLFSETWGSGKNYATLKKYFKIYIKGFDGASEIRDRVMQTNTPEESLSILDTIRIPH
jgi:tRNA-dihydrouridine synthase